MWVPLKAKIIAAVIGVLAIGGGAAALTRSGPSGTDVSTEASAKASNHAVSADGGTWVVDPATGERHYVVGNATGSQTGAGASSSAGTGSNSASTGVAGGLRGADVGGTQPPGGGGGGGGGGGSNLPGGGGSGGGGIDVPSIPDVPSTPEIGVPIPADPVGDGLATFEHGTYTVVVPGSLAVSKQLCLSGAVERCKTVSVPALQPIVLTVSYTSNISTEAPTFTVGTCAGGYSVGVAGLSPGASVTASANGSSRGATVPAKDVTETASLCDA